MVIALGTAALMAIPASAQQWNWQERDNDDHRWRDNDRDRGHDRDHDLNSAAYRDGFNDGARDRQRNRGSRPDVRRWKHDDDRRAYYSGYRAGYNGSRPNTRGWQQNGRGSYGYGNQAGQIGFQDGLNDGQRDRQSGHNFRPTDSGAYKHADHGYNSSFGNKDQYKQEYRQANASGYQRGYSGRGY
jgi:hypothetical protein